MSNRVRSKSFPNIHHRFENGVQSAQSGYPSFGTNAIQGTYDLQATMTDVDPSSDFYDPREFHPVYHTKLSAAGFSGECDYTYSPPTAACHLKTNGGVTYNASIPSSTPNWGGLVDELAASLSNRTKDSCMVLMTLKELSSTISMFRNPFGLMKPTWRKECKNLSASTLARNGANVWLEHLYGWKSCYRDLDSLAKACGQSVVDLCTEEVLEKGSLPFSATQVEGGTLSRAYIGGAVTNDAQWDAYIKAPLTSRKASVIRVSPRWSTTYRVGCRATGRALAAASSMKRMFARFDLVNWQSLRDLLWEAIPYSFVVDWFVDMRGIWAPLNYATISYASQGMLGYTTKSVLEYSAEFYPGCMTLYYYGTNPAWRYKTPVNWYPLVMPSTSLGRKTVFQRTAGIPPSQDWYNVLSSKGLSLTQLASGLSLIAQRIF